MRQGLVLYQRESAVIIGLLVSPVCFYAIAIVKHKLGYDDALDAFGCHGVGGIFGGIVTGLFTTPELALDPDNIGLIYGNPRLFLVTIRAIVFTIVLVCRHDICSHKGNLILHATPRFR